jgi:pimeloyl-ACP methyl ester carboxylesterase
VALPANADEVYLVGHSFGGSFAIKTAPRLGNRVTKHHGACRRAPEPRDERRLADKLDIVADNGGAMRHNLVEKGIGETTGVD